MSASQTAHLWLSGTKFPPLTGRTPHVKMVSVAIFTTTDRHPRCSKHWCRDHLPDIERTDNILNVSVRPRFLSPTASVPISKLRKRAVVPNYGTHTNGRERGSLLLAVLLVAYQRAPCHPTYRTFSSSLFPFPLSWPVSLPRWMGGYSIVAQGRGDIPAIKLLDAMDGAVNVRFASLPADFLPCCLHCTLVPRVSNRRPPPTSKGYPFLEKRTPSSHWRAAVKEHARTHSVVSLSAYISISRVRHSFYFLQISYMPNENCRAGCAKAVRCSAVQYRAVPCSN